ncbi:Ig-like domain-containing protein [Pantoea agglomerans]|uniref:Ig-like domain-containing protein n=1 Tax=Enterobacter agglomerans TaxID=549 RepID=UPI00241328BC|nr:Ig-like domain-containing protein [Pantoea agglomerans]
MEIANFIITPNTAVANGADEISASAVIMNGRDYVSDEPVIFTITTGSAIFLNGLSSITVSSDSLGAVSASLVDTTAENIVVEIALQSDAAIHDTLTATFTQSDNTADTINLLLVVDDARADGEDQNQVELQTLSGAVPVTSIGVSVALTNGAVFISGDKTAKIKTDSKGRASLPFTSTTSGESKLTAYISDNIAVYNSVTATFVSASPETGLVLDVVSDHAQANGNAVNRVRATVTDRDTQKPLSGQAVTFTITSGSAVFDNDSISYSTTTNGNGEAYASVKDNAVETVTLSAGTGDKTATATIHFSQDYAPLKIVQVYNRNKTFPAGGPSTAWLGADFFALAAGGSGEYSWTIDSEYIDVTFFKENNYKAEFIFNKDLPDYGSYTITVIDSITNEQDSYVFNLNAYFTHYADPKFYAEMLLIGFHLCPTTDELLSLYSDWGNMSPYGFIIDQSWGWYWTSDSNLLIQSKVRLVDGKVTKGLDQVIACCYSNVYKI